MKYSSKVKSPKETVEAIQYTVDNLNDVIKFVGADKVRWNCLSEELWIDTHKGDTLVRDGAYVVKKNPVGAYPLSHNLFHRLYKKVEVTISVDPSEATC